MKLVVLFGLTVALGGCGDSSTNAGNAGSGGTGGSAGSGGSTGNVECYEQTEVTQTIFEGDGDSLILADVPAGWIVERFTMQAGYFAKAVAPQDTNRPNVSATNFGRFTREIAELSTDELIALTSVMFKGEEVTIYYSRNQPVYGVNLEGFFPLDSGSDMMMQVTVLAGYRGSIDEQETCQDSLVELARLVAESIRENPDWAE